MSRTPALVVASLAAVAVVTVAIVLLLRPGVPAVERTPEALVPLLLAVAALCVVGLAREHRPTVSWLATIAAQSLATVEIAGVLRMLPPSLDADVWRWSAIALCLSAIVASASAAAYAADRRRRIAPWVPAVGGIVVAAMLAAAVWALATTEQAPTTGAEAMPLGNLSVVTRSFLGSVVLFVVLGSLADARPAAARARRRIAITRAAPASPAGWVAHAAAWLRAFIDEIAPGRTRAHRAALSERSRIARDLHAEVVPAVRRALAEAERDGSVERLAASLRGVLHEVDALVGSAHAIQLEVGGLVPALEWLAERVEERSDVRVTMDVDERDGERPGEAPKEVAAAAFRVAGLALENVIRHAPGSHASVQVRAGGDRVRVVIADDGPGLPPDAGRSAAAAGHRGIADMLAEASGCSATLIVDQGRDDIGKRGTVVTFDWPAASG